MAVVIDSGSHGVLQHMGMAEMRRESSFLCVARHDATKLPTRDRKQSLISLHISGESKQCFALVEKGIFIPVKRLCGLV